MDKILSLTLEMHERALSVIQAQRKEIERLASAVTLAGDSLNIETHDNLTRETRLAEENNNLRGLLADLNELYEELYKVRFGWSPEGYSYIYDRVTDTLEGASHDIRQGHRDDAPETVSVRGRESCSDCVA